MRDSIDLYIIFVYTKSKQAITLVVFLWRRGVKNIVITNNYIKHNYNFNYTRAMV